MLKRTGWFLTALTLAWVGRRIPTATAAERPSSVSFPAYGLGDPGSPAPPTNSQAPGTPEQAKYLLFWSTPEQAGELAERVGMKGDGKTRLLGFGLPSPAFELEGQLPDRIRSAFAAARANDMAVMLHFDFHLHWKNRPDLWNWFDPKKPGYDPNNKDNVEWHGWDGPPNKTRYINHGVLQGLPPNMCFTSKRIRSEITRIVSKVIGPVLREEVAKLKAEGREALFAGVLVGLEPAIDDYSQPSPEVAKLMKEDGVPATSLGYRALLDRGFRADHPPDDFRQALARIVQETIAFWCEQFVAAGIPAEKLYPHVAAPAPPEMTNAPIWSAFNKYSRPGWTTYPVEVLGASFKPLYEELAKHGNPTWAGVEANAGFPGSVVDWETYLAWHYNHGCILVAVNMGATGEDLPRRLWDSAFGKDAIAAYRKFLSGQPLVEKPLAKESPQLRIQAKMKRVRAGVERWLRGGKDPRAVAKLMEGAEPLAKSGKLDELEKLLDRALEMLGETQPTTTGGVQTQPPDRPGNGGAESPEAIQKRLTGKVERIKQGAQKWAEAGRDPSVIFKAMQEKFKPLIDAGKVREAEAELDRVLKQLDQPEPPAGDQERPPTAGRADRGSVWYTVGNLSVNLLTRAWGSPIIELMRKSSRLHELTSKEQITGADQVEIQSLGGQLSRLMNAQQFDEASRILDRMLAIVGHRGPLPEFNRAADLARERSDLLQRVRAADADGVEDYIGWAAVETKPGQWDWSLYQANAREIHKAGLKYIPYVWVQNLPDWVRHGADTRFATCLEHGKASEHLSVFSPRTVEAYDRVFAQLRSALGTQIDALRIGSPTDYGETHYPVGQAGKAFPITHIHIGWWIGEPEARQHFLRWVEAKYGTVDRLNAAWGTRLAGFDFDYPRDPGSPRRWLDFVAWYHEALTERLGVLFDVARKHFPETPICVNLGWPFEKVALGQDLSGLVKMLASKGMIVRTPTGPIVTHLYTRRVATAARFYHVPRLSSEPVDGNAPIGEIAGALFKDLTTGVTWHFDYAENMERARTTFQRVQALPRHDYPRIDAAVFFSTTAHRLENWDNWREGFQGGYPEGMPAWLEGLRDILDYDVVDERLIDDGALRGYKLLIWPFGTRIESRTLETIRAWLANGGTLLVRDLSAVRTVEGHSIELSAGQGRVIDAEGSLERLAERVRTRDRQMTGLPPVDARQDGVLASLFDEGLLLFNRNGQEATVTLSMPAGRWEVNYPGLPGSITLPPLAIRWVGRQGISEEARRGLRRVLHGSFLVFYARVQEHLKLTTEQKEKLEQHLQELFPDAMQFIHRVEFLRPEEREKELEAYRQKVQQKLTEVLKKTLEEGQRKRLRQLELQHEMPFSAETWKVLKVRDEQLRQFTPVLQDMQTKIEALVKSGGAIEEIWPKIQRVRKEHGDQVVALLSDAQKKQWQEMIGKPLDMGE